LIKNNLKTVKSFFGKNEKIPESWGWERVQHMFKVQSGTTPSRKYPSYFKGDIPWVTITDLNRSIVNTTKEKITEEAKIKSKLKIISKGTFVIAIYGLEALGTRGKCGILGKDSTINQACMAFTNEKGIIPEFFYYYYLLNSTKVALNFAQGTKQQNLSNSALKLWHIPVPSIVEQEKICKILNNINSLIIISKKAVEKNTIYKKSLMMHLFENGINQTKFKKIKWRYDKTVTIPEHWKVSLLDSVTTRNTGHTPSTKNTEYYEGNIKWISLLDTKKLDNVHISNTSRTISQKGLESISASKLPQGTVVLSRDATIGKSAIMTTEMVVSQSYIAWTCGEELDNYYLYYILQYWKPLFKGVAIGTTLKTIGLPFFEKLKIILPPISEQKEISSKLLNIDKNIQFNEQQIKNLEKLLKGLSEKLLSGQIRVIAT